MKWIEAKDRPKPKNKESILRDFWQFDKTDIAPLENRDSSELKSLIEKTDKQIKSREDSLNRFPDADSFFLRNGELYTHKRIPGGHITTEVIKAAKLYTDKQTECIADELKFLLFDRAWHSVLSIALIRRDRGKFYFDSYFTKKKKNGLETEKDYSEVKNMIEKNPQMTEEEIFKLIADDKNKSWNTVKSNYYYYLLKASKKVVK